MGRSLLYGVISFCLLLVTLLLAVDVANAVCDRGSQCTGYCAQWYPDAYDGDCEEDGH